MVAMSGIADQGNSAAGAGEGASEFDAVSFRFPVTWSLLSPRIETPRVANFPVADRPRPATPSSSPSASHVAPPAPVAKVQTASLVESDRKAHQPGGNFQWEMVVPKMVRPNKKGSLAGTKAAAASTVQLPPPPPQPIDSAGADPPISEREAGRSRARSFPTLYTTEAPRPKSFALKIGLAFAGLIAVTVPVWRHASQDSQQQVDTTVNGGDWMREAAVEGDPGVRQARQLVLYRPSLKATDGRLEFDWTIDEKGVGWVFRAKDLGNYYAMRLKLLKPGASPAIGVEYFAVHNYTEGAHSEKVLILSSNPAVLRVRMDVFGPTFTLYMQGAATVYWTDARLTSGATGFFEESHETASVGSVRMSFPERSSVERRRMNVPRLGELVALNGFPAGGA